MLASGWMQGQAISFTGLSLTLFFTLEDPACDCPTGWQMEAPARRTCHIYENAVRDCGERPEEIIEELTNKSCNMSLLVPSKTIQRFANRVTSGSQCDNLSWDILLRDGRTQRNLYFPALGLGPCTSATRIVYYEPDCWRQSATCASPEKRQERNSVVCEPYPNTLFSVVDGCNCEDEPTVVIIDDGIVIPLPASPKNRV